jgi:acetylornithine deacetylase/succinyl-diaminopimelate desuccinylase-like protein
MIPAALVLLLASGPPSAAEVEDAVRAHLERRGADVVRELAAFVELPNVAADEAGLRRNADRLLEMLRARQLEARLLDGAGGPPVVFGELKTPGAARTLVIYAHYDGQPVDAGQWASDPWKAVLRDGPLPGGREVALAGLPADLPGEWRLYGRSTSDDKASIVAVLSALDALRAAGLKPSVNVKLFLDGEEEAGSPHLRDVLVREKDILAADGWLFGDGPVHPSRRPQLVYGVRGITGLDMTVYGASRSLHSGHFGGWAPNPAMRLAHLLASLRDPDGGLRIPGLEEDVRPPTRAEREAVAAQPEVEAALREELALGSVEGGGARLAELYLRPAMNVRGLRAGAVGTDASNAVPTQATASIDFRLVPDLTPATLKARLESHLAREGWHVVHAAPTSAELGSRERVVRLEWQPGYPASRTPLDAPFSRAVYEVMAAASPQAPVRTPTLGGSLPMHVFEEVLQRPVIGLPIANHDNNQHAANENMRLRNLEDGIQVYAALLARLGPAWDAAMKR